MATWVALLRAVNLGPRNKISMADLRALLENLGYSGVRTLGLSGNAIFSAVGARAATLERDIASRILAEVELDITVLVRSSVEIDAVVRANPFTRKITESKALHAAFLSGAPKPAIVSKLDPATYAPDEFSVGKRVVYVRLTQGVAGSRLPNWEKALGVRATMRTWNVVTKLRELAAG